MAFRWSIRTIWSRWSLLWRDVQKNFEPALGFVSRRNVRLLRVGGRYNPRPKDFLGIQQMFHGVFYNRFTRLDNGEVESWNLFLVSPIDWHFKSGDTLHALFSPDITYERLFAPFEISRAVFLPPGEYRFTRWTTNVATAGKRRLQASVKWLTGTYWSGHADELQTTLSYKIPPRFIISLHHRPDVCPIAAGQFRRSDRELAGELCRVALPHVFKPDSVRQPVRKSGLAEPCALDLAAGE